MDTALLLDALFTLIASGCLLLLVYGAWLCLRPDVPFRRARP